MTELLQQVRILDPVSGTDHLGDVLLAEGEIKAVAPRISDYPPDTQIREGQGLILGTGLVDLYSHSGEPGYEERETLTSLIQAAHAGGFTRVAILPDTHPAIDHPATLSFLQERSQGVELTQLHFWGAFTQGAKGQQMTELAELASAGVVGFADNQPLSNLTLLRRVLEYIQPLNKPIALVPAFAELAGNGVMREGISSLRFGLPGNPTMSETAALAALLEMVAETGTAVHVMRISTARSVELLSQAKQKGLPVTASTTWMHLLLNSEAIGCAWGLDQMPYDPSLRLEPPLGNPTDQAALVEGVKQGVIDAIAIDHCPYTYEEKTVAFGEAPPGAIGLELALPLLWQTFVASGTWSALDLWRSLSTNPALCLKQTPAMIAPQQPAELVLFDPNVSWDVNQQTLKSRSQNTPWYGYSLRGRVLQAGWN